LCEIACEEIEVGNYTGRVWQPQAYKNIREKYWQRAKLWHPGREIRNKMTNLKTLYTDWVWLQQQTGCGRDPHGEVTATPAWWEREIKVLLLMLLLHLFKCSLIFFYSCSWSEDTYPNVVQIFLFADQTKSQEI
jgi:hypothetical protein